MSKITITELASVLMEKHGLKRTEAELFVRQLVIVINESLKKDKVAKVKGLGTFKVQAVSARKSVDVNTGESIVIVGRDKISFTADAAMRDLINAPFAQFETVVVNEGVDFSSIDDAINETDDAERAKEATSDNVIENSDKQNNKVDADDNKSFENSDIASIDNENANAPIKTKGATSCENTEGDNDKKSEANIDTTNNQVDINVVSLNDTKENEVGTTESSSNSSTTSAYTSSATIKVEPADSTLENIDNTQPQNINTAYTNQQEPSPLNNCQILSLTKEKEEIELENQSLNDTLCNYQKRVRVLSGCLILVAILVVTGIIYMGTLIEKSNNRIEHLIAQNNNLVTKLTLANANSIGNKTSTEQDSIKAINDSIAVIVKQNAKKATNANQTNEEKNIKDADNSKSDKQKITEEKKKSNIATQDTYNKDPRIRTGAYVITGIAKIVTAKEGQTMASISKTYLGVGMECYIEAVNGGDKVLKVGDKVKIPELKTKKSLNK